MQYRNKILLGNCLDVLAQLPSESVDCVVTSPPYWALRNYGSDPQIWGGKKDCKHIWQEHIKKPAGGKGSKSANVGANKNDEANMRDKPVITDFCTKCGAWRGELGLEPTIPMFIDHLCQIFDEVKRVLKKTGTCWVNLGDTYSGTGDKGEYTDPKYKEGRNGQKKAINRKIDVPQKSLCCIPDRFKIAMIDRGWICRNEIIWYKRNCMPVSARDRFTVDFEKVFFFTKAKKYYFEQQKEAQQLSSIERAQRAVIGGNKWINGAPGQTGHTLHTPRPNVRGGEELDFEATKNKRCVWDIPTKAFSGAHFAVFPEDLVITPIKAGCPEHVCKKCGKPREPIYEPTPEYKALLEKNKATGANKQDWFPRKNTDMPEGRKSGMQDRSITSEYVKTGYSECKCKAGFERGLVLDPFNGSGTTALTARKLMRDYVGIELKQDYREMAEARIYNEAGLI